MGADLWPARSNQSLFTQSAWIDNYFTAGSLAQPKLSMGLFAANLTYNGGFNAFNTNAADYAGFYRTEVRMFAGNDLDVTTPDATGWKGFGHYVPVRSVINSLPFETNFCVGQGKVFANNGSQQVRSWTDMSRQSLLPSWQWAKTGPAAVSVGFDFARAWYGGTSLRLVGSLNGNQATVKLYQTKLAVAGSTALSVTLKAGAAGPTVSKLLLYFADNLAQPELLDLGSTPDTLWNTRNFPLAAYAGRELAIVGVQATAAGAVPAYALNLGNLRVYDSGAAAAAPVAAFAAAPLVLTAGQSATFSNASTNASSYTWTFAGGSPASSTAVFPVVQYATPGTYAVKLVARSATGRDSLTRTGYISVGGGGASGGANTSLRLDGTTKYVDAGTLNLSGAALSLECWVKAASFKAAFPNISSLVGIEDPTNVALVRMGDAGLASNKLQFVLQVGTTARKLASPTALTANTWYHVAATFDGSTMKLYLNGVLDASMAVSGSATASGIFTLGRNYDSARILDGWLDEARAWTRALTPAEIAANACLVPGLTPGPVPGLAAYFRLNDGPGSIATDASGQGHTGALANPAPADWSPDVPTQCAMLATAPTHAPAPALQLLPLENPVPGTTAELELRGATGAALLLQVFDMKGTVVLTQFLKPAAGTTRVQVALPATAGLYVVRVGPASAKLLRL